MRIGRNIIGWVLLVMALVGCQKDQLSWQFITQINAHTTQKLHKILFLGDSVCIVGGGEHYLDATILRSTDGGIGFNAGSYPEAGKSMYGMAKAPNGYVYLCGTDGTVLHSTDSGKHWLFNRIGDWRNYIAVAYPEAHTGIYVSSRFQYDATISLVDSNFGILSTQTFSFGLNCIDMLNPSSGVVGAYGAILHTSDGGKSWQYTNANQDNFMSITHIGSHFWACGFNGTVLESRDGGLHWDALRKGNSITEMKWHMLAILFKNEQHGWATCDDGKLLYTNDGGQHWAEYKQFTTKALRHIALCPNGQLLVVGDGGSVFRVAI